MPAPHPSVSFVKQNDHSEVGSRKYSEHGHCVVSTWRIPLQAGCDMEPPIRSRVLVRRPEHGCGHDDQ